MGQPTILDEPPTCDCCERRVKETAIRPVMCPDSHLCRDCFYEWYENGLIDSITVKEAVWKHRGQFGGEADIKWRALDLAAPIWPF